jgi:hypothetical protein
MSGSYKTDDLVNDMRADMCGLIVKPARAFVLDQINEAVKRIVNADRTEH